MKNTIWIVWVALGGLILFLYSQITAQQKLLAQENAQIVSLENQQSNSGSLGGIVGGLLGAAASALGF